MALLAEEIVEEWLNRQGYFTIRGIKLGVDEIDLLATKIHDDGKVECRHIEVQASIKPVSYISNVPKEIQKTGVKPNNAKERSNDDLLQGISEWIDKKFNKKRKVALKQKLYPKKWTTELVINEVKFKNELKLIQEKGIKVIYLKDIISQLENDKSFVIKSASGSDFVNLLHLGNKTV